MMTEKIFFKNSKGDRLCGIISRPKSGKENLIVVMGHGFTSSKNTRAYTILEEILSKKGIATFRFDFYGHGESYGKLENITISEAVDDLFQAIKFVKKKGYKKIGFVGTSFGGAVGLLAASKSNELSFLALMAPVSDYLGKLKNDYTKSQLENWKKKGFVEYISIKGEKLRRNYSFFKDASKLNGYNAAGKIKIPVLILHGDKDKLVSLEQSKKTSKLIKNCRLIVMKGADHIFSKPKDFDKTVELISEFIIEHS